LVQACGLKTAMQHFYSRDTNHLQPCPDKVDGFPGHCPAEFVIVILSDFVIGNVDLLWGWNLVLGVSSALPPL